ncbi:MAG: glycoside hydrolase family 38 C-terminal domain-containing protein, partial [Acidimicrobiales bacterium]
MSRRTVAIVPHTHWDREWYSPYQTFRLRLVDLLDEFLPSLVNDLSYARFMLDGQMAVVDDYLEVRPEAEHTLRALAATGRLAMGPWYTLPDEFLVSGETHIRNLQMGLARASSFGGAMEVGYLPDMFGHVAQMPQLLRLFGFEHAVVWRGVPSAVDRTAFWWSAPDGSELRAQYLPAGYGNGAAIPDDAKALLQRVQAHEAELGEMAVGGLLFMNGTDHQVPQQWLGRVVAEVNDLQDDYHLVVSSLAEYLNSDAASAENLPSWTGELRSGARANLLMGVASNRVDVKQAAARTERSLEQRAEPLCALFLPADRWPASLFELAWKEVIRNAAHDSICACSDDEVVDAVMHRYAEARQIADGLGDRAVRALADSLAGDGPVIVNSSARGRTEVVEIVVPDEAELEHTQTLRSRPGGPSGERRIRPSDLASLLGQIQGQRLSETFFVDEISYENQGDALDVTFTLSTTLNQSPAVDDVRRELYSLLGENPGAWHTIRMIRPPMRRMLARVSVDGFGWRRWDGDAIVPLEHLATAAGNRMENGLVTVEVDEATGAFSLNDTPGFDRLVDGGDQGDTYNYCPPENDFLIDTPDAVEVAVIEDGPVRAVLAVKRKFTWPERVDDDRGERVGTKASEVITFLELRADESMVRVTTRIDNQHRDHRLRTHFPLPDPTDHSEAECAYAIVRRGLEAEGGPSEKALATYPSRRFVRAGGLTVAHEGLLE